MLFSLDFARTLHARLMVMVTRATRAVNVTARRTVSTRFMTVQLDVTRAGGGGEGDGVASDGDGVASDGVRVGRVAEMRKKTGLV